MGRLTPPEYAQADAQAVAQLQQRGHCDVYEKVYTAKDGRRVPILIGAATIDASRSEPEIAAFVTNLTPLKAAEAALRNANEELEKKVAQRTAALESEILDRKRAEMSLRELTGRLLVAQDEERRHMARELHDHAGQTLVALTLNLAALQELDGPPAFRDDGFAGTKPTAFRRSRLKEIRTLSYLLYPPLLDEPGLRSALQWYVEGFSKRSGIVVDLELPTDSGRIPRSLELVVFRIVQESLTNIHRHSGSPSANIRLIRSAKSIEVEIADRGTGIPVAKKQEMTAAQVGVGVRGMEERVRQFDGTLHIESSSAGTKVTAKIPLKSE